MVQIIKSKNRYFPSAVCEQTAASGVSVLLSGVRAVRGRGITYVFMARIIKADYKPDTLTPAFFV